MDDKQYGRYFFIDTKPSEENIIVSKHHHHPEESRDYESDHIDEEIEHRLYSMIHHHHSADDLVDDPKGDESKSDQQPKQQFFPNYNDNNKEKVIQRSGEGDKQQTICDSILINLNTKRRRKSQLVSPNKKVKPSTPTATISPPPSTSKKTNSPADIKQSTPSIIYLSDSDEDNTTTAGDGPGCSTAKRDLWHIDYKDYLISNPVHGKYYRPRIWCSRCKKEGNHPVKLCHLPKYKICYICGGIGHLGQHCQNQHCKRCMDFHSTSNCSLNVREFKCRICNKYGHLDDVCPNHWRKFHNITDPLVDPDSSVAQIQKNINKSCSICGRHQHYSFECERLRNRAIEISSPYDINTTFGGKFVPTRKVKPNSPQDIYQQFQFKLRTAPSPAKYFGRRSRYFNGEPNQPQVDHSNNVEHSTSNMDSVISSISQQQYNNNKSPKKKPKTRKRKNKQSKLSTDNNEIFRGGSIRSGKVKKPKIRQQQRKKQKKQQFKLQQQLMKQSRQSGGNSHQRFRPTGFHDMINDSFRR